jgi:8-oxo-dGTP pyrophosphatase MutT (NUDIX family)
LSEFCLGPRLQRLKHVLTAKPRSSQSDEVEAVVGVLLVEEAGRGLETLLIQRPERSSDPWSGQVGFPGGRVKATDPSAEDALRREVEEEVGIDLKPSGERLGLLSVGRPGRNPEVKVQPWVYALRTRPLLRASDEVAEAFWVSVPDLASKLTRAEVEIRGQRWTVDCYLVDGHIVWGFTFRVLEELMQIPEVTASS